ncbi:MAG: sulfatase [Verrucomicrobiota bacterium]
MIYLRLLFLGLLLSFPFTLPAKSKARPNVLFLAVDDMNDWIGSHGKSVQAITPNLDKLAARGVNFTNAHTAGVFCAPSRAAIFSGQFASTTGCYQSANYFTNRPEIESLQTSFSKAGYTTLGTGKLYHHPVGAIDPRGWTEFYLRTQEQRENGWAMESWGPDTPFPAKFPASVYNEGTEITGGLFLEWGAIPNEKEEEMADTKRINWTVEQLQKEHDKPFFLACGIYAPHYPNYCPQKYFDLYDPDEIPLPPVKEGDRDDLPPKIQKQLTNRAKIVQKLIDLDAWNDSIHGYLACISYADAMMGRVLDALEKSPYADNTIVVLWSDHGYHLGEKGQWGKHTLWERSSNVPFIWAGPGVAKGVETDLTASLIDMYPTYVEMCGLPAPHQKLEGQSLAATLADPTKGTDRNVFLPHATPGEYAVINRDWRYIRYGDDGEELYDLQEDPNEWTNLASDSAQAERIRAMQEFAPKEFAEPEAKFNSRKDLVIDGETYRWEKGKGNYTPPPKHLPYTEPVDTGKKEAAVRNSKTPKKKNILFIVCDDLNTHVSPSGYDPIHTPTLAEFAADAMTFHRAFCQYPVCGPSRASFLNGLYPESTGVLNNTADIRTERPDTVSMPRFFKENGYWTASTGKIFHSTRHEHGEVAWNEFVRFQNDELPVVTEARKKFEAEHGSVEDRANRKLWKETEKNARAKLNAQTPPGYGRSGLTDAQHKDGKNARQVASWINEKAHGDKPFFIACGIHKPHVPFLAPDKYFDLYPLDKITYTPDKPNLWDNLPMMAISKRYEAFGFELAKENDALRREYMQAYHACVSFLDAQLKLVFDALKKNGMWDDTIILFTSDHGYHLGDHFIWGKVTLFDIGAKVPFIVRVPGLTEGGTESQAMVELVDIYPTFADLAGLTPPDHLQGMSLRPLLDHPDRPGKKKYAYSVVSRGEKLGYALRNKRWRYGNWPDGEELYNLTNDPEEKRNLAGQEQVAKRLEEFRSALEAKKIEAASRR